MSTNQPVAVERQIYQALNELPPSGFDELIQFLDYLKHKYKHKAEQGREVILQQYAVPRVAEKLHEALRAALG